MKDDPHRGCYRARVTWPCKFAKKSEIETTKSQIRMLEKNRAHVIGTFDASTMR